MNHVRKIINKNAKYISLELLFNTTVMKTEEISKYINPLILILKPLKSSIIPIIDITTIQNVNNKK
jgi:hypothetical protein|tara:strand:- start:692 stop:889 length:198 start_codon:yes stop_codon:yes gene_type:complete